MTEKYYHGSTHLFGYPDLGLIGKFNPGDERPAKCALGLYVSPNAPLKIFADGSVYVYEITLKESALVKTEDSAHFAREYQNWFRDSTPEEMWQLYLHKRNNLVRMGYAVLALEEFDQTVGEAVILNLDAIQTFERIA